MRKRQKKHYDHGEPIAKIDFRPTTIFLVCIVAHLATFQQTPLHAFYFNLWDGENAHPLLPDHNQKKLAATVEPPRVVLTVDDRLLWNGEAITAAELRWRLHTEIGTSGHTRLVEYEPEPNASYDLSVKALYTMIRSGVPIRISGMAQHCLFSSGQDRRTIQLPSTSELMRTNQYEGWLYFLNDVDWNLQSGLECEPVGAVHTPS